MSATLQFLGAARTVTGSKHLIQVSGKKYLIDCGLFQGPREISELNWQPLPIQPHEIDAVLVTHAHIDHIGYLPRLWRDGFRGPIYCTKATADITKLSLPDSGELQEEYARYANKKGFSRHKPALPLYTAKDAYAVCKLISPIEFDKNYDLAGKCIMRYRRAGHILGSAFIEFFLPDGRKILFSGDLGRFGTPIIRDPEIIEAADILLIESTYGDRVHSNESAIDELEQVLNQAVKQGGMVIVPAFAIGRTQEMLYMVSELQREGRLPEMPMYVDSPMATDATAIYSKHHEDHDIEMEDLENGAGNPLRPKNLYFTRKVHESKQINEIEGAALVIASSGMASGGRVVHHLRRRLSDPDNTVLFVGYQSVGTLGRELVDGAHQVEIMGDRIPVRAKIRKLDSLSAHADANEIMHWLSKFTVSPKRTYLVHGDVVPMQTLSDRINSELGWQTHMPELFETVEILSLRFLFIVTIFLGSALLFLAQPMAAKMILPRFGGTPAVWTTSMLFFQLLLLAGYGIAHWLRRFRFGSAHVWLLVGALMLSAFVTDDVWWQSPLDIGTNTGIAWLDVITALSVFIGAPFLALSLCAPTIQGAFRRTQDAHALTPYFLYAASNLGSLLALLSYPTLIEPRFRLVDQGTIFELGMVALIVLLIYVSGFAGRREPEKSGEVSESTTWRQRLTWLVLAAVPSSLMLGLTTFATTNVAPVPLFWVVPLAIYLCTFISAFSRGKVISSTFWARILPIAVLPLAMILVLESSEPIGAILLIHTVAFAIAALMCHTRLAETKPDAENLTEFYLWLAIGGAVGGLFNAIVAPTVFSTLVEYPIAVVAACLLRPAKEKGDLFKDLLFGTAVLAFTACIALIAKAMEMPPTPLRTIIVIGVPVVATYFFSARPIRFGLAVGAVFLATHLTQVGSDHKIILADRSFFGVHRVLESKLGRFHLLAHGTTLHGIQDKGNPERPLTYYTTNSPIGEVFAAYDFDNVGMVGLGVGSCAAYGQPGQRMTFFEIDPLVIDIAQNTKLFTFLRDSKSDIKIVKGDARLTLAKRTDGEFALLVLDAFSSDAIPMHLLTREAMRLYLQKTSGTGMIALHISNRMLDLEPIVAKIALDLGVVPLALEAYPVEHQFAEGMRPSIWMVIVRDRSHAEKLVGWRPAEPHSYTPLWTDDYSNILSAWRTDG